MAQGSIFKQAIFYKKDSELEYQIKALVKLEKEFPNNTKIKKQLKTCKLELKSEEEIETKLKHSRIGMYVIRDLNVSYKDFHAQIDYIIITQGFIYIIECKDLHGSIWVNEKGEFTRRVKKGSKYVKEPIESPIKKCDRYKALIKKIWSSKINPKDREKFENAYDKSYKAVVVYASTNTSMNINNAPLEIKNRIIKLDNLTAFIRKDLDKFISRKEFMDSKDEMHGQAYRLVDFHIDPTEDWAKKYKKLYGLEVKKDNKKNKEKIQDIKPKTKSSKSEIQGKKKNKRGEEPNLLIENRVHTSKRISSEAIRLNQIRNNNKESASLKQDLYKYRKTKSTQNDVPENYIFTNDEIDVLTEKKPKSVEDLTRRRLLSPVKIKMFGQDIIKIIKKYDND